MSERRSGIGFERSVLIVALVSLALLAGVEFGIYRPQRARLLAAERELAGLQTQAASLDRRRTVDLQLLESAETGVDGAGLRQRYGAVGGLVHLNRLIEQSRLARPELRTEPASADGPFTVERFYFTLQGPAGRLLDFLRALESDERLMRLDQVRIEPLPDSAELLFRARVSIYSLPMNGDQP